MILHLPLERGITLAPWLVILPSWARGNLGYLSHEMTHAAQQRRVGTLTFWYRYLTDKSFRQTAEVEAYREQIAAGALARLYAMPKKDWSAPDLVKFNEDKFEDGIKAAEYRADRGSANAPARTTLSLIGGH